jgi:hypothetical protein
MRSAWSPARSRSLETFFDVFANCLVALPTVFTIALASISGRSFGRGRGTPSTVLRRPRDLSISPPATPAAAAPTATAGPLALLAALLAVSTKPPPVDALAVFRALAFEAARLGVLRLAELPELVRRFALDPLEPARGFAVRFALLFDVRFALLFDVRDALLFDVRDALLVERVLLFPLRAAAGFAFADFVPPELLLPVDFVDPLVRFVAVPALPSAISHPPSSAVGYRRRATQMMLD